MVFVFAYWKILGVIRRQAKIMAGHAAITTAAEEPVAGTSGATRDVNHRDKEVRAESTGQRQDKGQKIESSSLSKAKINVVRTMLYISICFTVCWMPMYTVLMITRLKVGVSPFLQRVRMFAMQTGVIATGCLSVCLSVTFQCFVQINEDTIVQFSASNRTIILVSGEVKFLRIFAGDIREGVKVKRP